MLGHRLHDRVHDDSAERFGAASLAGDGSTLARVSRSGIGCTIRGAAALPRLPQAEARPGGRLAAGAPPKVGDLRFEWRELALDRLTRHPRSRMTCRARRDSAVLWGVVLSGDRARPVRNGKRIARSARIALSCPCTAGHSKETRSQEHQAHGFRNGGVVRDVVDRVKTAST